MSFMKYPPAFNTETGAPYPREAGNAEKVTAYFELPTGSYDIIVSKTEGSNVDRLTSTHVDIPDNALTTAINVYYDTVSNSVDYETVNE